MFQEWGIYQQFINDTYNKLEFSAFLNLGFYYHFLCIEIKIWFTEYFYLFNDLYNIFYPIAALHVHTVGNVSVMSAVNKSARQGHTVIARLHIGFVYQIYATHYSFFPLYFVCE